MHITNAYVYVQNTIAQAFVPIATYSGTNTYHAFVPIATYEPGTVQICTRSRSRTHDALGEVSET